MIKLAIFDLDGTLINSIYDLADAVNIALEEKGYPTHETAKYYYYVGNGAKKLCERALPEDRRTEDGILDLQRRFSEIYEKICLKKTKPYEGIPELISRLSDAGIQCAVASNKPDVFSKEIVKALFSANSFDLIRGKREGIPTKPAPDIVYSIMDDLSVLPEDTVFIGDSCVDVETAHNAGLKCIGCVWGFRGEKELRESGCDMIAFKPSDILDIITAGQKV